MSATRDPIRRALLVVNPGARAAADREATAVRTFAEEGVELRVTLVVFDAQRSCEVRLARSTAPTAATRVLALETLDELARPAS